VFFPDQQQFLRVKEVLLLFKFFFCVTT